MSGRHAFALIPLLVGAVVWANPDPPGPATVDVVRSETILVPQGIFAPRVLYPEGRVDFDIIEQLVDKAVAKLTGKPPNQAWQQLFNPNDTVGLMIETVRYPVQAATVEIVIDRLVSSGMSPDKIIVFGGDERDLFAAGFNINRTTPGVRVLGAESEGFRGGLSRIVTDYCDASSTSARCAPTRSWAWPAVSPTRWPACPMSSGWRCVRTRPSWARSRAIRSCA